MKRISQNPEDIIIDQENTKAIQRRLNSRLSRMEQEVLHRYLQGASYQEIAKEMDKTPKTIDNALQRIKGKMQKLL